MGYFDEQNVWHWDEAFEAEIDAWTGSTIPDWRIRWQPRKEVRVTSARMDLRRFPESLARQPNIRLALSLQEATWLPQLWKSINDLDQVVFFGAFMPPGTCGQNGAQIEDECDCIQADLDNDSYDYIIPINCLPGENCYDPCVTGYWWDPFAAPDIETVVVPAEIWGELKAQLANGFGPIPAQTSFDVGGMYRITSKHQMPDGLNTDYHNRGYFEWTEFPLNN